MVLTRLGMVVRILVSANGSLRILTWVICTLCVYAIECCISGPAGLRTRGTILTVSEFSEPSEGHKRYAFFLADQFLNHPNIDGRGCYSEFGNTIQSGLASGTQDRPLSEAWLRAYELGEQMQQSAYE